MWDELKQRLKTRVKKILGRPLPPKPFEIIWEREGNLARLFQVESGELYPGFSITPEDTVVDVGCGGGGACVFAANQGAEVIGVDIDPRSIELTSKRLQEETSSKRWQTHVSDSNPLPIPSGTATKVICQEVLEHVDDPAVVIAELVRIGRPGTQYLLSVPDPVGESVFREVAPPCYWVKPCHIRVFERDAFVGLVEGAGLKIEKRENYSFFWTMWWILAWAEPGMKEPFGGANTKLLRYWNKTWDALLDAPEGERVRKALDNVMPKSQFVVARKAA